MEIHLMIEGSTRAGKPQATSGSLDTSTNFIIKFITHLMSATCK